MVGSSQEVLDHWLPWVHKFISNAKSWIVGMHHGVEVKYLSQMFSHLIKVKITRYDLGMEKQRYPKTIMEFAQQFPNDEACLKYLIESRWPDGFTCPRCDQRGDWWLEKYKRFECVKCHKQVSPLAGTLLHRSHLPIHLWFWATYLVTTHTPE